MEIERKFLINEMPEELENYKKIEIEQGYISTRPTIRIRRADERYILTVKSRLNISTKAGDPIVNNELECDISREEYENLKEKINGRTLEKTRFIIPIDGGLTIELDVFKGRLKGLVFAEVEFESVDAANNFNKPSWLGKDVSDDKRYRNSEIVKLDEYKETL